MTSLTFQSIDALELKEWIHDDQELALLDIREYGQYGEDHLFFAVSLPYSVLELDVNRLVPTKSTRIVIYAGVRDPGLLQAAAKALFTLGYTQVSRLQDGIESWKQAGFGTFAGVNLPSKTFGELAEHAYRTPKVSATELRDMLEDDASDVVILDGRPIEEYQKMNIPGSVCCPNGELALRIQALAPSPETTVVVNCAGRTRSIVGAQTLINLNIPNKVYALENGTQGWFLADLPLEHNANRRYPSCIPDESKPLLKTRALGLVKKYDLETVDATRVKSWLADSGRNLFLCDIRTHEEYCVDGLAGAQHAPGGQLIQATDKYVGVLKSTIVLCDFDGIRAPVVAAWLKQLGKDVYLLRDPQNLSDQSHPKPSAFIPDLKHSTTLNPSALCGFLRETPEAVIFDARSSADFRAGHLKDATWTIRPILKDQLVTPENRPLLLLGSHIGKIQLLAQDLEQLGLTNIYLCKVSSKALKKTGFFVSHTDINPSDSECIDYLFFVHDRHDGNRAAARLYLEWETNLVTQLDRRERDTFAI